MKARHGLNVMKTNDNRNRLLSHILVYWSFL